MRITVKDPVLYIQLESVVSSSPTGLQYRKLLVCRSFVSSFQISQPKLAISCCEVLAQASSRSSLHEAAPHSFR